MAQTPHLTIGTTVKIDNNKLTIQTIHNGYVVAHDKKGVAKVIPFAKLEPLF